MSRIHEQIVALYESYIKESNLESNESGGGKSKKSPR